MTTYVVVFLASVVVLQLLAALKGRFTYDTPAKVRGRTVELKDAGIQYPGHMAFATKGGEYFHGCRIAHFKNTKALNEFFLPGNAGHLKLVGDIIPQTDGSLLCVYTNKLSMDDMEDVDEFNRTQHEFFQAKKTKRLQERQEKEEKKAKEVLEQIRLAEVGKKYEARVGKIRGLPPGPARKREEQALNSGYLGPESNIASESKVHSEEAKKD